MRVNKICLLENDVLGPGKRVGVWFQGCSLGCKGCIVPELWKKGGNEFTPKELFSTINRFGLKEVSLSGGEPFEQNKEEFLELLKILHKNNFGIWVYTGYTIEELMEKGFYDHLTFIDVLVDGRYIEDMNDGEPWKGSSNQRILLISNRYSDVRVPKRRVLQIEITEDSVMLLGIPTAGFWDSMHKSLDRINLRLS